MALRDHAIPNETSFIKLSDFGDGEKINVRDCSVNESGKFGAQAYFTAESGQFISLPTRYVDFIRTILDDKDAMNEIHNGVSIVKNSRECTNGTVTATFEFM